LSNKNCASKLITLRSFLRNTTTVGEPQAGIMGGAVFPSETFSFSRVAFQLSGSFRIRDATYLGMLFILFASFPSSGQPDLLSSNSTCPDFSGSLVIGHNHSAWRNRTLYQCKSCRYCSILKQLFPGTKSQRVSVEPELVY